MDDDKLTFIVLGHDSKALQTGSSTISMMNPAIEGLPMIGDVNIFLKGTIPTGSPHDKKLDEDQDEDFEAEVEVMIAGALSKLYLLSS